MSLAHTCRVCSIRLTLCCACTRCYPGKLFYIQLLLTVDYKLIHVMYNICMYPAGTTFSQLSYIKLTYLSYGSKFMTQLNTMTKRNQIHCHLPERWCTCVGQSCSFVSPGENYPLLLGGTVYSLSLTVARPYWAETVSTSIYSSRSWFCHMT